MKLYRNLGLLALVLLLQACIISVDPIGKETTVYTEHTQLFSVKVFPNTSVVTWKLDDQPVGTGVSFTYIPAFADIGDHTLAAINNVSRHVWKIHVKNAKPDWSMYQGGPSHTGYVAVTLDPAQFIVRWEKDLSTQSGGVLNPIAATVDKVFVSRTGYFTNDQSLTAIDAQTGEILWENNYGTIYNVSSPSLDNGVVYIQTGGGTSDADRSAYMRAYNANTGEFLWRSIIAAQWEYYFAPTIFDGNIYADGGTYGGCYAFDTAGKELWFIGLNQYDKWTPAVDQNYVYAYTGEYDPKLSVIDRLTGAVNYEIKDPNFDWNGWSMGLAPVLGGSNDALAIHDGRLIKFDLASKNIGFEISASFSNQPAVANGVIYCINAGALEARDENSGTRLWAVESQDTRAFTGALIVTDSHVIVSTGTNTYAVSLTDHMIAWSYDGGTLPDYNYTQGTSPAWCNGVLYLIVNGTKLVAINAPEVS